MPNKAEHNLSAGVSVKSHAEGEGTFTAVVSVFGNVDSYGDRMVKGAFANSLKEWDEKQAKIPFIWSHDINNPDSYVGYIEKARETDEGLEVEGRFDMDGPTSIKAYNLLKSGRIKEFSFGYFVRDAEAVKEGNNIIQEVKEVELLEVSMTMVGANRSTRLVGIKQAPEDSETKAEDDEDSTDSFSIADLETAKAALESASDSVNIALQKVNDAIALLSGDESEAEEESVEASSEDEEVDKQAAVSEIKSDEEPVEVKADEDVATAAKAHNFEIQQDLIDELERMINQ